MKKIKYILIALFVLLPFNVHAQEINLYLFYGDGCPHCAAEKEYINTIEQEYGNKINVVTFEVWYSDANANLLEKVRKIFNSDATGVPYTVIGETGITGYNDDVASNIKALIDKELANPTQDVVSQIQNNQKVTLSTQKEVKKTKQKNNKFTIPILGKIDAKSVSLPAVAAAIGLADGFNPCAMWVLLFLISMLLTMKDKKKRLILGIIFLLTSAIVYILFMVAWLGIAVTVTQQVILRVIIGIFALLVGLWNLRSFKRYQTDGCEVVSSKKRKKIFSKIKHIIHEQSFLLAILGIIVLAATVNLIELACSAGLPLIFTSILALNHLSTVQYALYIGIYMLFFMLDDIIVFVIAMKTMEVTGISTKYNKWSHLIGGTLMLLIGILLIFFPKILMFGF